MKSFSAVVSKQLFLAVFAILFSNHVSAQTNIDSLKYSESNVEAVTSSGKIYGTLCVPKKEQKKLTIAIIIAGSGPTDRDGNSKYSRSDAYKMLAHGLAAKGIATLRYDKRGVGESESSLKNIKELTFEIMVNDAKAWVDKYSSDHRFSKLVVIGHSQGSLVGILVAQKSKVNTFISLSGIGDKGDVIIKRQLGAQPKEIQDMAFPIIDTLLQGKIVDSIPQVLMPLFKPSGQPLIISWFKYDPALEIGKLKIPILIIQGTNDIQVNVSDAKILAGANPIAKLELITNMNHLLKIVDGDKSANLATYNNPDLPIAQDLINKIALFIKK